MTRLLDGDWNARTTVEFVQKYVEEHYMDEVILGDLALVAHVSDRKSTRLNSSH